MNKTIALLLAAILMLCAMPALGEAPARALDQLLAGAKQQDEPAAEEEESAVAVANDGETYRVYVTDADGVPVEGAVIQFCDETTCTFQPTDAEGLAEFQPEEQKVYEVHVLKAPEGFQPDETVHNTLEVCSDVTITLERAQ